MNRLQVSRLSGSVGARVDGLNISERLDDDSFRQIMELFCTHHVLVFGGQAITPEDHIAFARRFGVISRHPGVKPIEGYPDIIEVIDPANPIASTWHRSLLHCVVSDVEGDRLLHKITVGGEAPE